MDALNAFHRLGRLLPLQMMLHAPDLATITAVMRLYCKLPNLRRLAIGISKFGTSNAMDEVKRWRVGTTGEAPAPFAPSGLVVCRTASYVSVKLRCM